jgi:ATP-dependent Zn protease
MAVDVLRLEFADVQVLLASFHESGHALVGRLLFGSARCGGAWINDAGQGCATVYGYGEDPRHRIMVSAGGSLAERFAGVTVRDVCSIDRGRILTIAYRHNIDSDEVRKLRRHTAALLNEHRDKLRRIADALRRHRALDGEAIDALMLPQRYRLEPVLAELSLVEA